MNREVLRLAGLLACMVLATSRIGLIGHELVGHGGMALACGGEITAVALFWFGGGWIKYTLPAPSLASTLAIMMAGIGFELVVGLGLWIGVRGDALGRRLLRGAGAALVVHATWYLATGAFRGFGDGLVLYRQLGDARVAVAIGAGAVTCLATFLGARAIVSPLARTLPGTARQRAIGLAVAGLLAGGLHAGLTIAELRLRRDDSYARMMTSERDRRIAVELQAWEREQAEHGSAPDADAQRMERVRLEREHRTFPFTLVLALATLAAAIAGIARSRGGSEERVSSGLLGRAVIGLVVSIGAVIVLDVLLG